MRAGIEHEACAPLTGESGPVDADFDFRRSPADPQKRRRAQQAGVFFSDKIRGQSVDFPHLALRAGETEQAALVRMVVPGSVTTAIGEQREVEPVAAPALDPCLSGHRDGCKFRDLRDKRHGLAAHIHGVDPRLPFDHFRIAGIREGVDKTRRLPEAGDINRRREYMGAGLGGRIAKLGIVSLRPLGTCP